MAGRLSSPRFRRRLLRLGIAATALAASGVVAVLFWNTADTTETWSGGPVQTFVAPEKQTLTKGQRQELVAVARRFLQTAVTRERLDDAYAISGPSIRGGLSLAEWRTGDIPVVPYPVDAARWRIQYAFAHEVGLEVLVYPRQGEPVRPQVFLMSLIPGGERGSRWLVDAFVPRGGSPNDVTPNTSAGAPPGFAAQEFERVSARMSALWLLAPVVLVVGVLIAVPAVLVVRDRRAHRRARKTVV